MNKDDQELFGIVKKSGIIPKRDFILMLVDNAGFNHPKMKARVKPFLEGRMTDYGYYKIDQVNKYNLVWGSSADLPNSAAMVERTKKELDHLLKIAKMHEDEDYFENYNETVFMGEEYLYCPTIDDSILLSIFNRDIERNIVKRYSKIQTAADFFAILEKTVVASSPNKWTEGMLFRDQFKFLKKQLKSNFILNSYVNEPE